MRGKVYDALAAVTAGKVFVQSIDCLKTMTAQV